MGSVLVLAALYWQQGSYFQNPFHFNLEVNWPSLLEVFDLDGSGLGALEIFGDIIPCEDSFKDPGVKTAEIFIDESGLVIACQSHVFIELRVVVMD